MWSQPPSNSLEVWSNALVDREMEAKLDAVVAIWREVGVLYGGPMPDASTVPPLDLERLLLHTTRLMTHMPRLFNTSASWLCAFGVLVAKHRFRRLVSDELDHALRPALGALLDTAQESQHPREFASVVSQLSKATHAESIFEVIRKTDSIHSARETAKGRDRAPLAGVSHRRTAPSESPSPRELDHETPPRLRAARRLQGRPAGIHHGVTRLR